MFNVFVNRNWKKLTDSRKRAKTLADNRKRHHPIETLGQIENLIKIFADEETNSPDAKKEQKNRASVDQRRERARNTFQTMQSCGRTRYDRKLLPEAEI